MLLARIGQSATGRYASAISLLQRVKFIGRVVADSKSTATLSIRSRPIGLSNRISHQEFATKAPASKPKAHTSRTTTRKTSSTKKAAPKKRKTARKVAKKTVKRARKPRVKKELSDEEKQKLKIRELKLNALGTPHGLPATAWAVLVAEITKNSTTVVVGVKEAAVKYRNLLPEEREVSCICDSLNSTNRITSAIIILPMKTRQRIKQHTNRGSKAILQTKFVLRTMLAYNCVV